MTIKDEIYPKVNAEVRKISDTELWIKVPTREMENTRRIILEDGTIFCHVFYEEEEDS